MELPSGNSRRACEPGGSIAGRIVRVCFFGYLTSRSAVLELFFAQAKKVTRAKRETLFNSAARKRSWHQTQESNSGHARQWQDQVGSQRSLG
jgi:hypothetical protein